MPEINISSGSEVVILAALELEWQAIRAYLQNVEEIVHPQGTIYHRGTFAGNSRIWRIAVAEIGMGGTGAASETERAINYFHPEITFFVGIAGGLKDVQIGDVVAATKVYGYESELNSLNHALKYGEPAMLWNSELVQKHETLDGWQGLEQMPLIWLKRCLSVHLPQAKKLFPRNNLKPISC